MEGGLAGESECFTNLGPYMAMAEKIRELDPRVDTIILTSEDARYLDDRANYAKDGRWRFILNPADTAKGTGTLSAMAAQNHTMHDIFLSMFTSLHLQVGGVRWRYITLGWKEGERNPRIHKPKPLAAPPSPLLRSSSPSTTSSTRGATSTP